jgi:hypothetical protein
VKTSTVVGKAGYKWATTGTVNLQVGKLWLVRDCHVTNKTTHCCCDYGCDFFDDDHKSAVMAMTTIMTQF